MAEDLEDWLCKLVEISRDPCNSSDTKTAAKRSLDNIKRIFSGEVREDVEDLSYAALFDKENGIFKFIEMASSHKEIFCSAITTGFDIVKNLIDENGRNKLGKYAAQIEEFCWNFWMGTTKAKWKEKALEVLISVYESCTLDVNDSEINFKVDELMRLSSGGKKNASTVVGVQFHLLGVLCRRYPQKLQGVSEEIFKVFIHGLEHQVREGNAALLGRFNGLREFLRSFPIDDEKQCTLLIQAIKDMVGRPLDSKRNASRAALGLLSQHGSLFSKQLMEEYQWWIDCLLHWMNQNNVEDKRAGQFALYALYQVIAEGLTEFDSPRASRIYEDMKVKITGLEGDYNTSLIAVRSLGYLSTSAAKILGVGEVLGLFFKVERWIEKRFFSKDKFYPRSVSELPAYVETLGRISNNLPYLRMDQGAALQKAAVHLIENFPAYAVEERSQCTSALVITVYHLSKFNLDLKIFLEKVFYQGLIRSCSFPLKIDIMLLKDLQENVVANAEKCTTCEDYIPFWIEVFGVTESQIYLAKGIDVFKLKTVIEVMFDYFMKSVTLIIDKLNLSVSREERTEGSPEEAQESNDSKNKKVFIFVPSNPKDHLIFINLVEMLSKVFPTIELQMMEKHVYDFIIRIIQHSEGNPLVSGFYKILGTFLHICTSLKYFEDMENEKELAGTVDNPSHPNERIKLFMKLKCFLLNMLRQVRHHKRECQVSCLMVFLATPTPLIKTILPHVISPMQSVFQIGYSYFPLANAGIDALERWTSGLELTEWDPILRQILPSLDPFLKSGGGQKSDFRVKLGIDRLNKASNSRKRYLVAKRKAEKKALSIDIACSSQLKRRILLFLGKLPPSTALALARDPVDSENGCLWDSQLHLPFRIPLPDMNPTIYIDKFLPRVAELSLTSSDRKTRIGACELLTSIMEYLIGKGAQLGASNSSRLSKLFKRLFPCVIQLACDSDVSVKDLFAPHLKELSQFYSEPSKLVTDESGLWLEALLDGLCNPHDAVVRNMCGSTLKDYVNRSLNSNEYEKSTEHLGNILSKICSLSLHSCQYKRIGASLALMNLYDILENKEDIVNKYWLELLHCQVVGLELCDGECAPSKWQMSDSIRNLERILKDKTELFNKVSSKRRKPPGFRGVTLEDTVYWLLCRTGSPNSACREESMRLFLSLAPHVNGCPSSAGFVSKVVKTHGVRKIISICEGDNGLAQRPGWVTQSYTIETCSQSDFISFVNWLNSLYSSLHCYSWFFENGLANPSQIFVDEDGFMIFETISDFFSSVDSFDESMFKALVEVSSIYNATLKGEETFQKPSLGGMSVQVFKFLMLIHNDPDANLQEKVNRFWNQSTWKWMMHLLFSEDDWGSDRFNSGCLLEVLKNLFNIIDTLPPDMRNSFCDVMSETLQKTPQSLSDEVLTAMSKGVSHEQLHYVKFFTFFHECSLVEECFKDTHLDKFRSVQILNLIFESIFSSRWCNSACGSLSQTVLSYLESLLKLSLSLKPQVEEVISFILNDTEVEVFYSQAVVTKGEHFYSSFMSCLITHMVQHCRSSVECLLMKLSDINANGMKNFHMNVIKDIISDPRMKKRHAEEPFLPSLLSQYWPIFKTFNEDVRWSQTFLDVLNSVHLGVLNAFEVFDSCPEVLSYFDYVLCTNAFELSTKLKALELLPWLTSEKNSSTIRKSLRYVFEKYSPYVKDNFKNRFATNSDLNMILQKVLIALEITCSPMLMEFFIRATKGGNLDYLSEEELQQSLGRMVIKSDPNKVLKAVTAAYSVAMDGDGDISLRLAVVKNFISSIIKTSDQNVVKTFFKENIKGIDQNIRKSLDPSEPIPLRRKLSSKIVCFQLIEVMFVRLNKDLEDPDCPITLVYNDGKPNEKQMIRELLARCKKAQKFIAPTEVEKQESLLRKCRCAAYNTSVAIVANLLNETKHYKHLFQEKLSNGERLWDGLVDTFISIVIPKDFDKSPIVMSSRVSICSGERSRKRKRDWEVNSLSYTSLSTQEFLADSTFNEDITKFDFQDCSVQSLCRTMAEPGNESELFYGEHTEQRVVTYERTELNNHECMATVTGLIQHLIDKEIIPSPSDPEGYDWVNSLKEAIEFKERHNNVKIFLVKVILNCESHLAPYAKNLIAPIMDLVADGCLGKNINYLITDVIDMLLSWSKTNSDVELSGSCASRLFEFFVSNAVDPKTAIFKYYKELIRLMFEAWHESIEVPYDVILRKLKMSKQHTQDALLGLTVSGLLLEHSRDPWRPGDKKKFIDCLLKIMENDDETAVLGAGVMGQIMRNMDPEGIGAEKWKSLSPEDAEFFHAVVKILLKKDKKNNHNSLLECLNSMKSSYTGIINKFISSVLNNVRKEEGKYKTMSLSVILSGISFIDRPFLELIDKGLKYWLTTKNSIENQQIALKMVREILPKLRENELQDILNTIIDFRFTSVQCRMAMFDIVIWIFDNYCQSYWEETVNYEDGTDLPWTVKCAKLLLHGLSDQDPSIQSKVSSFLETKNGLRSCDPTLDRLVKIVEKLYSPDTENYFLAYAIPMLLSPSASTRRYKELLFEDPLSNSEHRKYSPRNLCRTQHLDMVPPFADSLANSLSQMGFTSGQQSLSYMSQLKATQRSLAFTQSLSSTANKETLFTLGSDSLQDTVDSGPSDSGFKKPFARVSLKKRFNRYEYQDRAHFARREKERSRKRMEMERERQVKEESEITFSRDYYTGDVPHIGITYSEIIVPLYNVAKRDPVTARQLFVSLFSAVLKEIDTSHCQSELQIAECCAAFKRILSETSYYSSALIGSVLEISLNHIHFFPLHLDAVVKAAKPSGLSSLACLFLEEKLNRVSPNAKRFLYDRSQAIEDKETWLQLAKIYQGIEEYDVVHGIFHDVMRCGPDVKKALEFERAGLWMKGKKSFHKVFKSLSSDIISWERDYYYEGYFKCLENLCEWDNLRRVIMEQVNHEFDEAWDDEGFFLPWLFNSHVNSGLNQEEDLKDFFNALRGWLKEKNDPRKTYLQSHFSRELALIYSVFGQSDQARYFVGHHFDLFLEEWPNVSCFSSKIKAPKLLNIQLAAELSSFLSGNKTCNIDKNHQKLLSNWQVNLPNPLESLSHWEHRIACRNLYIRKMTPALTDSEDGMDVEFVDLCKISAKMILALVDMAVDDKNYSVAEMFLKKSKGMLENHPDPRCRIPWCSSEAYLPFVKCSDGAVNGTPKLSECLKSWKKLSSMLNESSLLESPDLHLNVTRKIFTTSKAIHEVIKANPRAIDELQDEIRGYLYHLVRDSDDGLPLTERISKFSMSCLEASVSIAENLPENYLADQYLTFAKYCHYLMEDSTDNYEEMSMKSILRAMAHGSRQARHWFPCILLYTGLSTTLSEAFKIESSRVPAWMFLGWTSQILAHLKGPSCSTLEDLVIRLAETYPEALAVPFKVSSDACKENDSEVLLRIRNRLRKVLTKNRALHDMIKAFSYVCCPNTMLSEYLKKFLSLLNSPDLVEKEVEEARSQMIEDLFPAAGGKRMLGPQFYGPRIDCLNKYRGAVLDALQNFTSLHGGNLEKIKAKLNAVKNDNKIPKTYSERLKDYSQWLAEFRSSGQGGGVEIPGQYTGENEPRAEEHIRIVGFHPKVNVILSKCRPFCLTILGSDAREYKFLVKFGEDLRLDQRIEQLFGIMNKIFAENQTCIDRKLYLDTYQVIPLATNLGIIEWVDGTKPLGEILSMSMKKKGSGIENSAQQDRMKWILKAGGTGSWEMIYGMAYLKYGRQETVQSFKRIMEMHSCDILRRSLLHLSHSLEGFWSMRCAFATSYATMCIAQWLLGIGDRHLNNSLVSTVTGRVIGIDFGYSFGFTTQSLPVPELMPFRMTPQIMGLMQPLGEVGLMREVMIHTLRALQEKHDILLATMDVFVKEPSIDWLDHARNQAMEQGISDSELVGKDTWYPLQKVSITKKKLIGGTNPVEITLEELSARDTKRLDILEKYKEVARGEPQHNIRADLPAQGLSCEEQVSCLIDQATDYNLLGKTWIWWQPWL